MENGIIIRRLTGSGKGKEDRLTTQEASFGTGPHNTVRFDPSWDRGVAPSHARLYRDPQDQWWIEDAGSATGTFVNGQRVTMKRAVQGPTVIELGQGGPKVEAVLPPKLGPSAAAARAPTRSNSGGGGKWLALAALLVALGVAAFVLTRKPGSDTDERLRQIAKQYEKAVGVVIFAEEGKGQPNGTAWAVGPRLFATNSHITDAIEPLLKKGGAAYVVINKHPDLKFRVTAAITHPKYVTEAARLAGAGLPLNMDGKPQSVGAYDVGLLQVDGDPPVKFTLASKEKLLALDAGHRVAFLGFPMENLNDGNIDMHYPVATMQSGIITSVTDAWMAKATPENSILIHHNLPSAGGASGSPVFDADGEVVGLHCAGNYTMGLNIDVGSQLKAEARARLEQLKEAARKRLAEGNLTKDQQQQIIAEFEREAAILTGVSVLNMTRVTSASLINFAQRADLLREMLDAQPAP